MKLYRKCKKRIAQKYLRRINTSEMNYFLSLRVGDWISGCTNWPNSSQITEIKVHWSRISSKARVIDVIRFEDNTGRVHYYPGGGCVDAWDAGKNEPDYIHNPSIQTPTFTAWLETCKEK